MDREFIILFSLSLVLILGGDTFAAQPLQQDSGPDGIVSVEAEHYDDNVEQGGVKWELVGPGGGFTGNAGMQVLGPSFYDPGYAATSPRLDFEINFVKTGTYYVWILAWAASGSDDSCHVGLDGEEQPLSSNWSGGGNDWSNGRYPETDRAQFEVTTTGIHVLNIWVREDGLIVDKIVLTTNPDYTPTGNGPPESERLLPGAASGPSPANGATDVSRDVILNWTSGDSVLAVNGHKVYLSDSFNDVSTGIEGTTISTASYAPPQRLAFETTYYWRVDETSGPPDSTVYEGSVWSFTTEPISYPIDGANITATASSVGQAEFGPENTVDGSGLDVNDLHSTEPTDMWVSNNEPLGAWIQYEFDKVYKLHEMWVWNSNQVLEPLFGFGLKDVTIEYSSDGATWTALADVPQFTKAPGRDGYAHDTTVDFGTAAARYVKLTANSNWGGILPQFSISEVRFFSIPVVAREPSPDTGTTDTDLDITLAWRPGREAGTHSLYLSDNWNAVADGTALMDSSMEASYGPVALDIGKRYFWRIDEVNDVESPAVWQGDIWSFKTIGSVVIDDFEDYNDYPPHEVYSTWSDGYDDPTNGSQAGNLLPPLMETTIVHDGQSMPLLYDNSAGISEVSRTISGQRDWTARGIGELSLWFRGNPAGLVEDPVGTYTITAAGYDIWGNADEFRYYYKQISGDCEITAKVESVLWVPGSGDWSKAGVMIRGTLDAGSPNAFICLTSGAGDGASFQWRQSAGGSSSSSRTLVGISPPTHVKLVRQGNTFTGYVFLDGQWQQEGNSATVTMPNPVYIGLAFTSHSSGVTSEAVFSEVMITGAATGQFTEQVIGDEAMPSNDPAPLYVGIANPGGAPAIVSYSDAAASQIGTWTQWRIDLQEFATQGVNLADVDKIFIGLGDKTNPQPGGSGTMYIDDIELYPQATPLAEVWLEAEAADTLGASWRSYDDPNASGGKGIGSETGDGHDYDYAPGAEWTAAYSFTAPAGEYKILLRAQETGNDSFWVRIPTAVMQTHEDPDQPGTGWVRFNGIDAPSGWAWDEVHSDDHNQAVVTWILPAGDHTLEIAKREEGVLLDAILITNNLDQDQDALPDAIPQP